MTNTSLAGHPNPNPMAMSSASSTSWVSHRRPSPSALSPPATPEISHERLLKVTHGNEDYAPPGMNNNNNNNNNNAYTYSPSGASSPAKTSSGISYISNTTGGAANAAGRRFRQSPGGNSVHAPRYSMYKSPSAASPGFPASSNTPGGASSSNTMPSRHLITVIPPDCLPHDPPHPRANPQASGYGPPENFKRGVLLPLYPTLAGQLGAVAREYGLPSSGGLIVYLLELSTEVLTSSSSQMFVGGPRITEDAWQLLWSRLFEHEAFLRDSAALASVQQSAADEEALELSELEDDVSANYSKISTNARPPVPPVPEHHRGSGPVAAGISSRLEEHTSAAYSDESSRASIADASEDPSPDFSSSMDTTQPSMVASPTLSSHVLPPLSGSRSKYHSQPPKSPPPTSGSRPQSRSSRRHERAPSSQYATYPTARPPTSQSVRSMRRRTGSSGASAYAPGPAVIVGKLEFDIDRHRPAGRWYNAWVDQINGVAPPSVVPHPPSASASVTSFPASAFSSPAMANFAHATASLDHRSSFMREQQQQQAQPYSGPPTAMPPAGELRSPHARSGGRAELFLPSLVHRRSHLPDQASPSSVNDSLMYASAPEVGYGDTSPAAAMSLAKEDEEQSQAAVQSRDPASLDISTGSSLRQSQAQDASRRAPSPSEESKASDEEPLNPGAGSQSGYAQLDDDNDDAASDYGQDAGTAFTRVEDRRQSSQARSAANTDSMEVNASQRDPLGDMFGSDEASWQAHHHNSTDLSGSTAAGLGFGPMPDVLNTRMSTEAEEDAQRPPVDDVQDVKRLLDHKRTSSKSSSSSNKPGQHLSSPIHLDQEHFAGPTINYPAPEENDTGSHRRYSAVGDQTTPPHSEAFNAPTITRESPSIHEQSRTSSVVPEHGTMMMDSVPEHPHEAAEDETAMATESEADTDHYKPSSPSKWASFAALHEEGVSPAPPQKLSTADDKAAFTTTPGANEGAEKEQNEQRESFEMDFDSLEKALAELSPRSRNRTDSARSVKSASTARGSSAQQQHRYSQLPFAPARASTQSLPQATSHEAQPAQTQHSTIRERSEPHTEQPPLANGDIETSQVEPSPAATAEAQQLEQHPKALPLQPDSDPVDLEGAQRQQDAMAQVAPGPPPMGDHEPDEAPPLSPLGLPYLPDSSSAPVQQPVENTVPLQQQQQQEEEEAPAQVKPAEAETATTFDALLPPQATPQAPAREGPPPRGSSLHHSLRKPWNRSPGSAASLSPTSSPALGVNEEQQQPPTPNGSSSFFKFWSNRKNASPSSQSEGKDGSASKGLSPILTSKLNSPKTSPHEKSSPMFNNPPSQSSTLAQRRRGFASPPASPQFTSHPDHMSHGPASTTEYTPNTHAQAYFDSESSDPLAGLAQQQSPKPRPSSPDENLR